MLIIIQVQYLFSVRNVYVSITITFTKSRVICEGTHVDYVRPKNALVALWELCVQTIGGDQELMLNFIRYWN